MKEKNRKEPLSITTSIADGIDYHQLIDSQPDLVCQWLPDGILTFANKAYCDYFRKDLSELVGKTCLDYIHPDDQEKLMHHIARFDNEHTQAFIELKIIDPDGKIRFHQWNDRFVFNETEKRWEFLSTGRDVTELKKAEIKLNKRIEFERLLTKHTIEFINLFPEDIDQHITSLLAEIGYYADVDRTYVFLFDDSFNYLSNSHEWCREGISPQIANLQNIPVDTIDWWASKIRNFETVLVPEVAALPKDAEELNKTLQVQDILSVAGAPLVNAGRILGFVGFDAVRATKHWSEDDKIILNLVSGIIGSAIAQKRSQEASSEERQDLKKLNEITFDSLNSDNIQEMLSIIAAKSKTLINAEYCSINLWDKEHEEISLSACDGDFSSITETHSNQEKETELTKEIFQSGELLVINEVSGDIVNLLISDSQEVQSLLVIPIVTKENFLGSALFGYAKPHHFSEHDIQLAQQASSQIALAILKQHLLDQAKRSAKEAATLHKAGTIVAATLDPKLAIESILDQLELVVPFDSASVQILHEGYVEIRAGKGWTKDDFPVGLQFPIPGDNPNSQVILSKQPFVLNNAPEIYKIFNRPIHSNIRSWLGVPLQVHDKVIGVLTLDHHEPNFYNNDQLISLASAFADQVAISLENSRLYAAEKRRVQELDALRATTADITQELAIENLIQAILERATALLNATGGELGLVDSNGEQIQILVSHNMGENKVGVVIEPGEGLMGHVAKTQQIEMIEDYQQWMGKMDLYEQSKIHAAIAAPLMIGNHFLGVIGIMNSDGKRKFTASEKSLMSLFAQQAAIAVQNAQLFEERKQQARMDLTTGIYNRRGLFELGIREIDRAYRFGRPLAAIMVDIDHFKQVNDTYGHPVGDLVLKELAVRMKENLRSIDILSRYGGEEFVILLPETSADQAAEVAERIRQVVAETPFTVEDLSLPITISQGVAVTNGEDSDMTKLIKQADNAMYVSKGYGRNQVNIFPNP